MPFSARLPKATTDDLKEYARQTGVSTSVAAAHLLAEGLAMARFPGIDFRWTPTGRTAFLTGTGLAIWEVYRLWKAFGRHAKRLLEHYPHISAARLNVAIAYAKAHPGQMVGAQWGTRPPFARIIKI